MKKMRVLSIIGLVVCVTLVFSIVYGISITTAKAINDGNTKCTAASQTFSETNSKDSNVMPIALETTTWTKFINYSGSLANYHADISCARLVGKADKEFFQIILTQTKLTESWFSGGPNFVSVKITVTSPNGKLYEHKFEDGEKKEGVDLSGVLFGKEVLVEDGTYYVNISGSITSGATAEQSGEFSFVYDSVPPKGSLSVDNGSITNSTVNFNAQSSNDGVLYYGHSYSSMPNSTDTKAGSNLSVNDEGYYNLKFADKAGNYNSYKFIIDKTAPELSLSGVTEEGFTNGEVSASWSSEVGNINAQRVSTADVLTVKYSISTGSTYPTSATRTYNAGTPLTEVGNYLIVITDSAGNKTEYKFTIDKSAPKLSLNGVAENGFTNGNVSSSWSLSASGITGQLSNSNDSLMVKYTYSTSSSFPTTASSTYTKGVSLTKVGNYLITIQDKAGNMSKYYFTIDKTAPKLSLNGVAENGFTNGNVSAAWSKATNGSITGQLSNSNDSLSVRYSFSSSAEFPTGALTSYSSDMEFNNVGNYLVVISDKSGNRSMYRFTIDKSAPELSLNGVAENGFTNGNVSAAWTNEIEGVRSQLSNVNDRLIVKYSFSTSGEYPDVAINDYSPEMMLTEAGNYLIAIQDISGNISYYCFTIDRSAPALTLEGVSDGAITKTNVIANWSTSIDGVTGQLSNEKDSLTLKYSYLGGLDFPTSATRDYLGGNLSNEGNYLLIILDKAGNFTSYTFTIDKTAPNVISTLKEYTNQYFRYEADDLHGVATVEFRLNGGNIGFNLGSGVTVEAVPENYGVWEIRSIDIVGNVSDWQKVNLLVRSDFGNLENAKNEFKVAAWYTVTLSAKNFPAVAGKYSFENYNAALNFAVQKEWDYRVVTLSNGTWSYASIANSSVTQIYTKRAELDAAIDKYAKINVSTRTVLRSHGGDYHSPTDENGIVRPDALTKQNLALPDILSDYANLSLMLVNHDYIFTMPEEVLSGNISTFVLSFISDGITLQPANSRTFRYGNSIKNMLAQDDIWQQGYYLVTETDLCGNVQEYLLCLDLDTPSITAEAQSGDGSIKSMVFDAAYAASHKDVMLYTALKLERITDNLDEYAMLMIDGRGLSEAVFLDGDELPELSYENGYYGKYTITIYDRSFNALTFIVTIAGAPPKIGNSSLTNETRCRITITLSDANNAITSIRFFKVSYSGEYAPMYADDDGNVISPEVLEYSLRTGGKYVIIITDVFGREIQSEPLFYMKGLPSGTLSGVKQNGITNNTVTFKYENTNKILVYIFDNGNWVASDDKAVIEERSGYNYATIAATEENSYQYKIFLHIAEDMNLFVEYIFEIDCIPPAVKILTDSGEIDAETVTRLPFRINWTEYGITAYYYNKNSPLGEIGKERYAKDKVLTDAGMYVFEIKDQAGNLIEFTVTVDNSVNYELDGSYTILSDGSYISKNYITLTVKEITAKWECESSNNIVPENGQKITVDGTYKFRIEDLYGNILEITIIIDNLPPEPNIQTSDGAELERGGKTNKSFNVTCNEDGVSIVYSSDGKSYSAYDGSDIEAEGKHYFKLTDRMGNSAAFFILVDKTVDYTVTGKYIEVENGYLAQYFTLTVDEEYSAFNAVSSNGVVVEIGKRITVDGVYTLTITDLAGNIAVVIITIDLSPPTPTVTTSSGAQLQPNGKTNEPFAVTCDEVGATLFIEVGTSFTAYDGELLSLSGIYTFRLLDAIGNELIFTVEIDGGVSYDVGGKYTKDDKGQYVSNTWLSLTVTEEFVSFVVTSDNGRTFINGEKIVFEGVYSVTVTDYAGNVETIGLIIDFTPPVPTITTSSGKQLQPNSKTNEAFNVNCDEEMVTFEFSRNGHSYALYDNSILNEPAIYYFKITDLAGNELIFTIQLDSEVDFTVSGKYKFDDQGRYVSSTSLAVTINEEYKNFIVESNNGIVFGDGEKISDEGVYTITIIDFADNVMVLVFVIDKTPPLPIITTASGKTLQQNETTNEAFVVNVFEKNAAIYWSMRDAGYVLYDGSSIEVEGKYHFKLIDFIGNSSIFTIEIDKTVMYSFKGLFKTISEHVFATNSGVVFTIDEQYTVFNVKTDDGQEIVLGEKIVREGKYNITVIDKVGNKVIISLHVDYTAPIIDLSGVEPDGITGNKVTVVIDDYKTAYYQMYGSSERVTFNNDTEFIEAGQYTLVAEDHAGNRTSITFTIDGDVDITMSIDLKPGQFITDSIEFKFNEKMSSSLLVRNGGEPVAFNGGTITENGEYTLTIIDLCGNTANYSWTILPAVAKEYSITIPPDYAVSLLKDGNVYLGAVHGDQLSLNVNGSYELTFSGNDTTYTISLTVDTVNPTVEITQKKDKVIIDKPNKDNVKYELTLDGKAVNFEIGKALTAVGDYVLKVTDAYGNQSIYNFSLNYMNAFAIAVIVIAALIVIGIIVIFIVTRLKQGVR